MTVASVGGGLLVAGVVTLIGACTCCRKRRPEEEAIRKQVAKLNTLNKEMATVLSYYFIVVDFSMVEQCGGLEEEIEKYRGLQRLFQERCSYIQQLSQEEGSVRIRGKRVLDAFNRLIPSYSQRFEEIQRVRA